MAHNDTEIGTLLKQGKEQEAADALLALLEEYGGNVVHAAIGVGVNRATVKRWLARLENAGWDVRDQLELMRNESAGPTPMSAEELAAAEERVSQSREVSRCLAWLCRANEETIAHVAKEAGVRRDSIDDIIKRGVFRSPSASGKIMVVVSARLERQRKAWREKRRAKSTNQG